MKTFKVTIDNDQLDTLQQYTKICCRDGEKGWTVKDSLLAAVDMGIDQIQEMVNDEPDEEN